MREKIDEAVIVFLAFLLIAAIVLVGTVLIHHAQLSEGELKPITQEWIDEETRCFYSLNKVINCETVRGYE